MHMTAIPVGQLVRCTEGCPFDEIVETFEDYNALYKRLADLWTDHKTKHPIGMTIIIRNRWQDDLHVVITDAGWMLLVKRKGEPSKFLPGDIPSGGAVAFLTPDWHWSAVSGDYLMRRETAEEHIKTWLLEGRIL